MPELQIGKPAPTFTAPCTTGETISLKALKGKQVVLYFYPKDDTPGCTKQACGLRDSWKALSQKALLYGISHDPIPKHLKFIEKYNLPFPLLSDEDHSIAQAYGFWVEKSMYGKKYMGMERSTVLIDEQGKIKAILRKVKPETHLEDLLKLLES